MIKPGNLKKHLRIYCAVGLMISTTVGLSELTRPSYALLTSTTQASMTFSAAASFPKKVIPIAAEGLIPSETPVQPVNGASGEPAASVEASEQSESQGGENQVKQKDQISKNQSGVDSVEGSSAQSDCTTSESTENAIKQTVAENTTTESAINQTDGENTATEGAIN